MDERCGVTVYLIASIFRNEGCTKTSNTILPKYVVKTDDDYEVKLKLASNNNNRKTFCFLQESLVKIERCIADEKLAKEEAKTKADDAEEEDEEKKEVEKPRPNPALEQVRCVL